MQLWKRTRQFFYMWTEPFFACVRKARDIQRGIAFRRIMKYRLKKWFSNATAFCVFRALHIINTDNAFGYTEYGHC